MSRRWPPPPDLASIQELLRNADPEGLMQGGAPADEYEPEEKEFFATIADFPTADLLATNLLPILNRIWMKSFNLDPDELAKRQPALLSLAKEIERFFGPESQPRTRAQILAENEADKVSPA